MSNAVLQEVKSAREQNSATKSRILHNVLIGRVVKKYRCVRSLSTKAGLSRNKLRKTILSKSLEYSKQERFREVRRFRDDVIRFFERDDNSRNLPGKADKTKTGVKESTQKRVLTDYLSNLHAKYISENPSVKLSLASFQRIRPKYIMTTSFITRDSCLCTKHQNMALVLKAIRREGCDVSANPETYLENTSIEISDHIKEETVMYEEWRRVAIEEKGKKKMVMRVVKVTATKEEFISHLQKQTQEFKEHVSTMRTQYQQIRLLKERLPVHHAIVHMDFAENYNCKSMEEIQSAYWNQTSVTLHPTVVYTRTSEDQPIQHQSYVLLSDDLNHNSTTVATFLKTVIQDIKESDPAVECVHYWTDSPTSQYRNKTIFNIVANHQETFGISARWNYFEAGHGKGPCDGLGGSTKRMADEAIKSGKVLIQDAKDFYAWTQSSHCTMRNVRFRFIDKKECESTEQELGRSHPKPIKGTMKIHAVVGLGSNSVMVRDVSCYCDACLWGNFCDPWKMESTSTATSDIQEKRQEVESPEVRDQNDGVPGEEDDNTAYEVGQFVVALYEGKRYLGKVVDTDPEDVDEYTYQVSFLEQKKRMFQWPSKEDVIWCRRIDIPFKVSNPKPSGKSKRMLVIDDEDWAKIDDSV